MHNQQVFASIAPRREILGLEETEEQVWSVYVADYLLGRLHQRDYRVRA
jgi:hypothetical protein